MGLLDRLLHGPAALAMKQATPAPTIADSMGDAVEWPDDDEFAGAVNGLLCREYAVRVVTDYIVRQIASLPLKVYRRLGDGSAEEVTDPTHPLLQVIRRPSDLPGMTRYRFTSNLLRDMLLEDRWLCVLGRRRDGDGARLRRIPADCYSLDANALGELVHVRINGTAGAPAISRDLPDPAIILDVGVINGLAIGSPVTAVLRPLLSEARSMAKYRRKIAENGPQTPAYIYRPKEMPWESQDDYDAFVQGLRSYQTGGGREGLWLPLRDGMEVRAIGDVFKPVDMADLEAREKINEQVCLAFQISPENIGFRTGTNSNIAAYKEKLWNIELLPYLAAFEEALNLNLPASLDCPDCYIKANLDAKLRGTLETQYQALSTATGRAFMTTNYARALLDMPPVPGGDDLVTPLNVISGGQPSPQDGGRTQNAQQAASPNGKTARGRRDATTKGERQ